MSSRLQAFGLKSATPTIDELRELQKISKTRELTSEEQAKIARATREDRATIMDENLVFKLKSVSAKVVPA